MAKYLKFEEVVECWPCVNCRVHRVDHTWQCAKQNEKFGNPMVGAIGQCHEYSSEAGTDKEIYDNP